MFDSKSAGRLLKQDWARPAELARELYSMITSRAARQVEAPVSIAVPPGKTALRLARSDAPSRARLLKPPDPGVTPTQRPAKPAPTVRLGRFPLPNLKTIVSASGPARRAVESLVGSTPVSPPRKPTQLVSPSQIRVNESPPAGPASSIETETRIQRQVQVGPGPVARPSPSLIELQPVSYTRPYQSPLFEVAGAIRAEAGQPVQFDANPVLLNQRTGEYEPFNFTASFTEVPRETPVEFWWGQVTSKGSTDNSPGGDGLQQYNCDLFRYPGAPAKWDNVAVRIYVLDPADTLPKTYPLFPIWLSPINGFYYAQPPLIY